MIEARFRLRVLFIRSLFLSIILGVNTKESFGSSILKLQDASASLQATGKPGFLRINGEGALADGEFIIDGTDLIGGEIKVHLDSLKTGLELRDQHMKEKYLETGRFPVAIFKLDPIKLPLSKFESETNLQGILTIHGISKPATLKIEGEKSENGFEGSATADLNVTDFEIKIPEYLGIKVADKVKILAKFRVVPKK
jgi:polyisoprenoid-binding protein YceI